jgi:hypothetical protein
VAGAGSARSAQVLESPLFSNALGWPVGPLPAADVLGATFRYRLHLPLWNGVTELQVGVPADATLTADTSWNSSALLAPIVYVGTSIAQGGNTPRPGTAFATQLGRLLGNVTRGVVNLGFSGSCRLEEGLAAWVARACAGAMAALAIDCGHDMPPELIRSNTAPFVRAVRAALGRAVPGQCPSSLWSPLTCAPRGSLRTALG